MAALATIHVSVVVEDQTTGGLSISRDLLPVRLAPGAGLSGQHQTLTLATGNNTLSVPSGSFLLLLELTPAAPVLTLKGANADVGIPLVPSSNPPGLPALITLGTSPTVIINNAGSSYQVDATWI